MSLIFTNIKLRLFHMSLKLNVATIFANHCSLEILFITKPDILYLLYQIRDYIESRISTSKKNLKVLFKVFKFAFFSLIMCFLNLIKHFEYVRLAGSSIRIKKYF